MKRLLLNVIPACCIALPLASRALASDQAPSVLATTQPAATRPAAPVQKFQTHDLRLNTNGAAGDLAEWLKPFDLPPALFAYTMQAISEDEQVRVYRLIYPSPFNSPFPENNVVPAELYV